MGNTKFLSLQVPVEMDKKLRMVGAQMSKSRSEIVRLAIEKFLGQFEIISLSGLPHPTDIEPFTVESIPVENQP
jgi:predicted DNA-binding protein